MKKEMIIIHNFKKKPRIFLIILMTFESGTKMGGGMQWENFYKKRKENDKKQIYQGEKYIPYFNNNYYIKF